MTDPSDENPYAAPEAPSEASLPSTNYFLTALKGAAMGAANVIPGVSGGTIAFITGIYQRLLDALKSFDTAAIGLLKRGDFKGLARHTDFGFLAALGVGVVFSFVILAKVLEKWFVDHPILVWAFFFGLILASIPTVARMVKRWTVGCVIAVIVGVAFAVGLSFLPPAAENANPIYLILCGAAAMCSMIIPGISGSFVLLLMGNYLLVLRAVNDRNLVQIGLIGIGAVAGLLVLSRFLSWLFKRHHDIAVATITGFVLGSLRIIWPWKVADPAKIVERVNSDGETEEKVLGYLYEMPNFADRTTLIALGLMVLGAVLILIVDRLGGTKEESASS